MAEIKRDDILDSQIAAGFDELAKVMGKTADELDRVIQKGIELAKVQKDITSSGKSVAAASNEVNKNAKETENQTNKLNDIFQNSYNINKELEKQRTKEYTEKQKAANQTENNLKLINSEGKSLQNLSAQNKALTAERNKLDLTTEEGQKTLVEYNKRIETNSKIINKNGTAQEQQRANIGRYRSDMGNLFVAFKNGEIGLKSLGKQFVKLTLQMLANPIVLIIAAIVGVFLLLYKAISRTDAGATEMEARFAQLKVIFDVVLDRVYKFAEGIKNIFTGNFKQAAENFGGAVKGSGEQLRNAAKAAYDYVYALDALQDAEIGYISQKAKNENDIAKLEAISADKNNTVEVRRAALESAIKIGEEELKKAKEFANKKYNIEIENLAKTKGISANELKEFIAADDKKEAVLLKNNKKLAEVRNLIGDEGQQKLEELYSASIVLDTKFFEENKRNISKLSGFEEKIRTEKEGAEEKEAEEKTKRIEKYKKEKEQEAKFITEIENSKIQNTQEGTDKQLAQIDFEFEQKKAGYIKDVENVKLRNQLIEQAEIEHQNKTSEVLYDEWEKRIEEDNKRIEEDNKRIKEAEEAAIESAKNQTEAIGMEYEKQLIDLKTKLLAGEINEEQYADKVKALSIKQTQAQIDVLKELLKSESITAEARINILYKIQTAEGALLDFQIAAAKESKEAVEKTEKEKEAIIKERIDKGIEAANEAFGLFAALQDRQLSDIEAKKNYELSLVGDNETAKAAIERKYAEESARIKRKQAIADKAQGLFNVAINTAMGITAALATVPPNPFLAVMIGMIGGLQAAAILAKPIPQFDKGTASTPDTYIAGERRPEFRIHNGKAELITDPTFFTRSAGDSIVSGVETARLLSGGLMDSVSLNSDGGLELYELRQIRKAIGARPSVDVKIDRRGISTIYEGTKEHNTRIDKYFS